MASLTKCHGCHKEVYAHERMFLNNEVFHKGCAKCVVCSKNLTPTNFAVGGTVWYCKTHYAQAFVQAGGRYPGEGSKNLAKPTWKETLDSMSKLAPANVGNVKPSLKSTETVAAVPIKPTLKNAETVVIPAKPGPNPSSSTTSQVAVAKETGKLAPSTLVRPTNKPTTKVQNAESNDTPMSSTITSLVKSAEDLLQQLKDGMKQQLDAILVRIQPNEIYAETVRQIQQVKQAIDSINTYEMYLDLMRKFQEIIERVKLALPMGLASSKSSASVASNNKKAISTNPFLVKSQINRPISTATKPLQPPSKPLVPTNQTRKTVSGHKFL